MSDFRSGQAPPDVPDLEVPEPVPSRRPSSLEPERVAPTAAEPLELELLQGSSSALPELDLSSAAEVVLSGNHTEPPASGALGSSELDDLVLLDNGASFALATEELEHRGKPRHDAHGWPSGRTPELSALEIGEDEVAREAEYGPAPSGLLGAPAYALRVVRRQRILRKRVAEADAELRAAEGERDARLAEMVSAVRAELEQNPRFSALLAPLSKLEQALSDGDRALAGVSAELDGELEAIDAELGRIRAEIAEKAQSEQALGKAFAERESTWKRADARLKRTNIEIRNLVESYRKPGEPPAPIPPDKAALLEELKARLEEQKLEATRTRDEHDRANAELSSAQHERAELEREARRIEQQRLAVVRKYEKRIDVQSKGLHEIEHERVAVLAEIGRTLLAERVIEIAPELLARVADADRTVGELSRKAALRLRALDSYDRAAVKQGQSVALGLACAATLLLIAKLLL